MKLPVNAFKAALARKEAQIGLWVGLADPYVAELLATTGFDWLLIDGEHAPNDVRSTLAQLQAIAPYPVSAVVRPVEGDTALIKQCLDIGALTLLVPMVETAAQAAQIVAATRYAPRGVRGLGSALARASRWSGIDDYVHHADEEICVLVQVESAAGLADLEGIAAVDGVDGVFFGPADLCVDGPPRPPAACRREEGDRRRHRRGARRGQGARHPRDRPRARARLPRGRRAVRRCRPRHRDPRPRRTRVGG